MPNAPTGLQEVAGPFSTKSGQDILIGVVTDPTHVGEKFHADFADLFRDVFAHGAPVDPAGWSEYTRCTDCGQQHSLEDAYGLTGYQTVAHTEAGQETTRMPPCSCGGTHEFFWPKEQLIQMTRHFFRKQTFAAFMYGANQDLLGFSYAWIDPLGTVWDERLAQMYGISRDEFMQQVHRNAGLTPESYVLHYAETGIALPYRSLNGYLGMIRAMLNDVHHKENQHGAIDNLPVIAGLTPDSNSFKVFGGTGCEIICRDQVKGIVTLHDNFSAFHDKFDCTPREFLGRYTSGMKRLKTATA